jgi:hypothetical protein
MKLCSPTAIGKRPRAAVHGRIGFPPGCCRPCKQLGMG